MPGPPSSTSAPRTLVSHPELASQRTFPTFKTLGEPPKGSLERMLSVFADVRAGEGVGVLLLAANIFVILACYYLLRSARQGLILTEGAPFGWSGAQVAAYSSAGMALTLLGVVPLYGWLGTRVPRMRLMTITTLFFASNLVLFYLAGRAGIREGIAFYVWLGVFNMFIPAQFWGFANDLYTEGQGRRLFPLIGVGASLGAVLGAAAVGTLVRFFDFTPFSLMALAAPVLLFALALTYLANRRETSRADEQGAKADKEVLGKEGGFELVFKDRYLMWIAVLAILLNLVNSVGNFLLNTLIERQADTLADLESRRAFVTLFASEIDTAVSILSVVLQLFVTSRALRVLGVRGSLFILPVLALVNYSIIAVVPILAIIRWGKVLENSTDYSIQNTLRQALFLPTSREAKYKAKAAIDTFFTRFGDVMQAAVVFGLTAIGVGAAGFAWLNVALTVVWLAVAGQIAREHRRRTV